ncbi:MAG TPA: hypothetical protein PK191_05205 [Niabella sp.]|nr:hypothetical protein [Niabella sp.]HOZ96083.1 hypothetical protein [Niabella sp.]HQW13449.1 hypothetical protein [Niabella sp.]HQX18843.1 hypothetical protein [Niabella sp.]HRB07882.1 hypothetical protein [Niabella sp.]
MTKWRKVLIVAMVLVLVAISFGLYLYTKKPPDIRKSISEIEVEAATLIKDFEINDQLATNKYVDKVITVIGRVADIKMEDVSTTVFLETGDPMSGITCSFYDSEALKVKDLQPGSMVVIKGICTGKLADVILNKCSIVQ